MYAPHNIRTMDATHETIVAKFGSRLSIEFRPQTEQIFMSPIGRFFDKPYEINFGVIMDGVEYGLKFGYRQKRFQYIEQHEYIDRVVYRCRDFDLGLDCKFEIIAPFVPKDEEIVNLPAIYLVCTINRFIDRCVKKDDDRIITVFFDARMTDFQEKENDLYNRTTYYLTDDHIHYQDTNYLKGFLNENPFHKKGINGEMQISCLSEKCYIDGKTICVDGRISQHHTFKTTYAICGFTNDSVLSVENKEYKLEYTKKYKNIDEVVSAAKEKADEIIAKSTFFSNTLGDISLGKSFVSLLGLAFRTFASDIWLAVNEDNEKWYSVVEGGCLFHSTVDVEYNDALFYYMLWPELLESQLRFWKKYMSSDYIDHDIGAILNGGKQVYPHAMEIEENCNYILMLYAYFKMFGKVDFAKEYLELIKTLVTFNKSCDTTGNGLANKGTANTIDDSSDDVQFAEEQIYLGIKEYASYLAAKKLFDYFGVTEYSNLCKEESDKILNTIESRAWREDHYAVTLVSSNGKISEYSLYQSAGGNVSDKGKDAYSIYTANGLLYLWLVGDECELDLNRLLEDAVSAHLACETPYGDTHSSVDTSNIWISQNIWRDLCAGYLGVNMFNNVEKYWEYEVFENQGGRGGCFIDSYGWNKLNYHPRGITTIGYYCSLLGLSIDGINKEITLKPCISPLKLPIFQFADWENQEIPYVEFYMKDNQINFKIINQHLLKDYVVKVKK